MWRGEIGRLHLMIACLHVLSQFSQSHHSVINARLFNAPLQNQNKAFLRRWWLFSLQVKVPRTILACVPTLCPDSVVNPLRLRRAKGVCLFSFNLLLVLFAE